MIRTHTDIVMVMEILQLSGAISKGWVVREETYELVEGESISDEQLAAAIQRVFTIRSAADARSAIRTALRAKWDDLPAWIRGPFQDKFAAANTLLDAGQDDAAEAIIQYAEVPAAYSVEQAAIFATVRTELLAALSGIPPVS